MGSVGWQELIIPLLTLLRMVCPSIKDRLCKKASLRLIFTKGGNPIQGIEVYLKPIGNRYKSLWNKSDIKGVANFFDLYPNDSYYIEANCVWKGKSKVLTRKIHIERGDREMQIDIEDFKNSIKLV